MKMIIIVLYIFCMTVAVRVENITNFGNCLSPNKEEGHCIHLENCTKLKNLVRSPNLRDEDIQFLRQSHCGSDGKKILICCTDKKGTTEKQIEISGKRLLPQPGTCGNVLSNRIIGGIITKIDEFPWMALIEYKNEKGEKNFYCGGSLINNRYVITAAHCAENRNLILTGVRLGEWDLTTEIDCEVDTRGDKDCAPSPIDVPVEKIHIHPGYNSRSRRRRDNDIALLRLAQNVIYNDFIRPICLPLDSKLKQLNLDGFAMDISGWGDTEFLGNSSNIKLKAIVPVTSLKECQSAYSDMVEIFETQICAGGEQGKDACRGDSGGPLIGLDTTNRVRIYYYLAGIVSFGISCGTNIPGVYTKVSPFVDWIEGIIEP